MVITEPLSNIKIIYPETIGIVTTCHSYYSFIDDWLASVKNLTVQPDRIVIAASDPDQCEAFIPRQYENVRVVAGIEPFGLGKYLNAAIQECHTDWIVWLGIDDRYRRHALEGIRSASADVIAFGMQYSNGMTWIPSGTIRPEGILNLQSNLIPCGSPFRRKLWEQIPFQEDLAPFEDWALWVGFAKLGAKFLTTNQIDFDYSQHPEQIIPSMEPTRSRIAAWSQSLK